MNIDKAIEILTLVDHTPPSGVSPDFKDVIKLGIEALKERQQLIKDYPHLPWRPLQGED